MVNILGGSSCRQRYKIGVIITYICARPQATQGAHFGMGKHFYSSFLKNKCEESIKGWSISDIILQTEREREGDKNPPSNHSSKDENISLQTPASFMESTIYNILYFHDKKCCICHDSISQTPPLHCIMPC